MQTLHFTNATSCDASNLTETKGERIIDAYFRYTPLPLAQQLARNIKLALRVAGPAGLDRSAQPLRSVALQQRTGIARSTLRALIDGRHVTGPNPDLHTLARLADALGIPVAFLLMRPEDWRTMGRAINDLQSPTHVATMLVARGNDPIPLDTPERVLQRCGMQPETVPHGLEADRTAVEQVAERNENRRRGCQVLASLMLPVADTHNERILMTALAASLANQLSYERQRGASHAQP